MVGRRTSTDKFRANGRLPKVDTSRQDKMLGVWVWEYALKHTLKLKHPSDRSFLKNLSVFLPFPEFSTRLNQMAVINLLSHYTAKDLSIEKILNVLELILNFIVEEPEDVALSDRFKPSSFFDESPSPDVWRTLQQPILELKAELRKLLSDNNADAEYVIVIKSKLTALLQNAWTLFGPLSLERMEAAVINGSYEPHGVSKYSEQTTNPELDKTTNQELDKAEEGNIINQELENTTNQELDKAEEVNQDLDKAEEVAKTTKQELEKARQALNDSCVELEKLVKDPLPALLSKPGAVKRSLMEPHPSAQAQGWSEDHEEEDEIEESPTGTASKRIRLPAIRESRPSESRSLLHSPIKPRRVIKKWTEEEVDTLKREVQKYGKGRWKMILLQNKDVFQGRTEVDIKDKWRNLEKFNRL